MALTIIPKAKSGAKSKFQRTVEQTPLADCYQSGLKALGGNSSYLSAINTKKLQGSVDLDSCLKTEYPASSRWDYVLGYDGKAVFIEVHPGSTSEVSSVINKLRWLKEWLNESGKPLENFPRSTPAFVWICKNGVKITHSSKLRQLAQSGIHGPIKYLTIS